MQTEAFFCSALFLTVASTWLYGLPKVLNLGLAAQKLSQNSPTERKTLIALR